MLIPLISFPSLRLWTLLLLSLLVSYTQVAFGLVNVTVEHGDPQIAYGPKFDVEWKEGWPGVMKSSDSIAAATFTFTGTALFYEGWLWSGLTMFQAQIDDETPITIDLTDHGYAGSPNTTAVPTSSKTILLWPLAGTIRVLPANETEVSHTINFSKNSEQREIIIGKLIYSTDNPPPNLTATPAASAPNATSSSTQSSSAAQPSTSKNLQIIIPSAVGGVIALGLLIALIVCCIRRGRQPPRVRFDLPTVTKTTTVTQDQTQMKNNGGNISLKRATRGLVDQVWDPRVIHVKQVDKAPHPNWRIE